MLQSPIVSKPPLRIRSSQGVGVGVLVGVGVFVGLGVAVTVGVAVDVGVEV